MSDLWNDDVDLNEQLSDGDDKAPAAIVIESDDDLDYMIPDGKRQKLAKGKRAKKKAQKDQGNADDEVVIISDDDSDKRILRQAKAAKNPTPQSKPKAAALKKQKVSHLDAKTRSLIEQSNLAIARMQHACDDDVEILDDSDDYQFIEEESPQKKQQSRDDYGAENLSQPLDDDDDDPSIITIKIACSKGEKSYRIRKTDPFKRIMDSFKKDALREKWIESLDQRIKYVFDGDTLNETATANALDMDDEDKIDAYIS